MNSVSTNKRFSNRAKILLGILTALLAVLVVSAGSTVSADTYTTTQGITFDYIASEADYDYTNPDDKYIYFNTMNFSSGDDSLSENGRSYTSADGNIEITVSSDFQISLTRSSSYVAIIPAQSLTYGETVVYGSAEAPAVQITVRNAGYTSDGDIVDVKYTLSAITLYHYDSSDSSQPVIARLYYNGYGNDNTGIFVNGFHMGNDRVGQKSEYTVGVYYSGGDTLVEGYSFAWRVTDLDNASLNSSSRSGEWAEAIVFLDDGDDWNTIYLLEDSYLVIDDEYQYDGGTYTRLHGSREDELTLYSGFITEITNGEFTFLHVISRGGTTLSLASDQDSYSAGITVSKTVSGYNPDYEQEFEFKIEAEFANGTPLNGTHGGVSFVNGVGTFYLKHGESFNITGLAAGMSYTVTEVASEGYATTTVSSNEADTDNDARTATGTTAIGKTVNITFDNERDPNGDLEISKTISGDATSTQKSESYSFTVKLSESVSGDYTATYSDGITDDTTVTVTFENGVMTKVNGEDSDTISLTDGQTITIKGLPAGTTYTVTEDTSDIASNCTVRVNGVAKANSDAKAEGTITAGTVSQAAFDNHFEAGALRISKTVNNKDGDLTYDDQNQRFEFTVTATLGNAALSGTYDAIHTGDSITSITFDNDGKATVYLQHGQSITIMGLPEGTSYTVEETKVDGYDAVVSGGEDGKTEGTIAKHQTSTAAFTNIVPPVSTGNLEISKIVSGSNADREQTFTFTISLSGTNIADSYEAIYSYSDETSIVFSEGEATVYLQHGQSVTILGLPDGTSYTVTETGNEGYDETTVGGNSSSVAQGQINDTETSTAAFHNHNDYDPVLEIEKTATTDTAYVGSVIEYTLTVTQTEAGEIATNLVIEDALPSGLSYVDGSAKVYVAGEEIAGAASYSEGVLTVNLSGLAHGNALVVTYEAEVIGDVGDFITNTAKVTAHEDSDGKTASWTVEVIPVPGNLTISKTVSGAGASQEQEFAFTITLVDSESGDPLANVAYDDIYTDGNTARYRTLTFDEDGTATVYLKHGESVTIYGLPAGVTYTVTEDDYSDSGYTSTVTEGETSGDIITGETVSVAFDNYKDGDDVIEEENEPEGDEEPEGDDDPDGDNNPDGDDEAESDEPEADTEDSTTGGSDTADTPKEETLPQTGQLLWPILVMAVLGAVLLMAGLKLCRSKGRRDRREK